jgi:nucleoside-diphosphate-sugar epimerase
MKSRSVSVTGATGFFGWHIASEFQRAGWRVRAIVRPGSPKPLPAGVERFEASLSAAALGPALAGSDVVVHAAGVARSGAGDALQAVNVEGTGAVVDAVNAAGSRLVLISSQAAAGTGTSARPSREQDEPRPLTAYGRSKLAGEAAVRTSARVPWTILRPSAIYGPRDRQFLSLFRMAAGGRLPLAAKSSTMFTLIDVTDAARAVILAAEGGRAVGQTFFIGHPAPHSAEAVLEELARVVGRPVTALRLPAPLLWAAALGGEIAWRCGFVPLIDVARLTELRAEGFVCSVAHARDTLGFTAATPLPDGLARAWRWYREQGWI